jgi:hypothetical protein
VGGLSRQAEGGGGGNPIATRQSSHLNGRFALRICRKSYSSNSTEADINVGSVVTGVALVAGVNAIRQLKDLFRWHQRTTRYTYQIAFGEGLERADILAELLSVSGQPDDCSTLIPDIEP